MVERSTSRCHPPRRCGKFETSGSFHQKAGIHFWQRLSQASCSGDFNAGLHGAFLLHGGRSAPEEGAANPGQSVNEVLRVRLKESIKELKQILKFNFTVQH
jgi:cytochrome c peroxidase